MMLVHAYFFGQNEARFILNSFLFQTLPNLSPHFYSNHPLDMVIKNHHNYHVLLNICVNSLNITMRLNTEWPATGINF
jgi:hypothetical protein